MAISIVFDKTAEEQIEKVVTPQKRLQDQVVVKSTDEEQIILPDGDNVGIKKVIVEPAGGQKLDDGVYSVKEGQVTAVTLDGLYGVVTSGEFPSLIDDLQEDMLYYMTTEVDKETGDSHRYYASLSSGCIVSVYPVASSGDDKYTFEELNYLDENKYYKYIGDPDYTLEEANPFDNLDEGIAYEVVSSGDEHELNALSEGLYEVGSSGSYDQVYLASSAAYIADGNSFTLMPDGTYTVSSGEYSNVSYGGDGAALRATSSGESVEYVDTGVYNIINENGYSYFEDYYGLTDGVYDVSEGHADRVYFGEDVAYTGTSSGERYEYLSEGTYTVTSGGHYTPVTYGNEGSILKVTSSGSSVEPIEGGLYWINESEFSSWGERYSHSDEFPAPADSEDTIIGFSSGTIYSHVIISDIGESETLTIGEHHYTITRND